MKNHDEGKKVLENKKESGIVTKESFCATGALFSILALLILCTRDKMFGGLGLAIHNFLMGFFGYFAYPIILVFAYLSIMGLFGKRLVRNRKLGAFVVLTIFAIGFIAHTAHTYNWSTSGYVKACFQAGETFPKTTIMGVCGGIIVFGVTRLMTNIGAIVLFGVLTVLFAYLAVVAAKKGEKVVKEEKLSKQSVQPDVVNIPVSVKPAPIAQTNPTDDTKNTYVGQAPAQEPIQQFGYTQPTVTQRPGVSLSEDGQAFSPFGSQNGDGQGVDLRSAYEFQNSREFLFGGTPAENYSKNLLFDPTAKVNQRPPVDPTQPVSSGYESYSSAYENSVNNAENIAPARVFKDETQSYQGYSSNSAYQSEPPKTIEPMQTWEEPALQPQEPVSYPIFDEPKAEERTDFDVLEDSRREVIEETEENEQEGARGEEYRRHDYMDLFSTENPRVFGDTQEPDLLSRRLGETREERVDVSRSYTEAYEKEEPRSERDGLNLLDDDPYELTSDFSERNIDRSVAETRDDPEILGGARMGFGREIPLEETREAPVVPTAPPIAPKAEKVPDIPKSEPKKPRIIRPYVRVRLDDLDCRDVEPMANQEEVEETKATIIATLEDFKVTGASVGSVTFGPTVTRYNLVIPRNISPKKVVALDQSIAIGLHSSGVNVYPNYDEGVVSIEVPNKERQFVQLGSMLAGDTFVNAKPSSLMFAMGKDVANRKIYGDISKMIHMLVAGASGSGKSVFLGALIISLIYKYSPEELRLILIDPKKTEFVLYNDLPHLMINEIITDVHKTVQSLNWAIGEMNRRYELFEKMSRSGKYVVNLDQYNEQLDKNERLPKIVIIIDELADLMLAAKKEIEDRIQNLTQKARAAGIHLIVATQRPSTDVITGVIKSNLPTRIAFGVATDVDSRVILDQSGAQKLLGKGDFLYTAQGINTPVRVQSAFISPEESQRVVNFIKQNNEAYYDEEATNYINNSRSGGGDDGVGGGSDKTMVDPMAIEALKHVIISGSASISMIQRKCATGYNRAGKIIEWMEEMGYISAFDGAKARKVLITKDEYESIYGPMQ